VDFVEPGQFLHSAECHHFGGVGGQPTRDVEQEVATGDATRLLGLQGAERREACHELAIFFAQGAVDGFSLSEDLFVGSPPDATSLRLCQQRSDLMNGREFW
jgi:hypothetical protein